MEIVPGFPHVKAVPLRCDLFAADPEGDPGLNAVYALLIQSRTAERDLMRTAVISPAVPFFQGILKSALLVPLAPSDFGNQLIVHTVKLVQIESESPEAVGEDLVISGDIVPKVIVLSVKPIFSVVDFFRVSVLIFHKCPDPEGGVVFTKPLDHIGPPVSRSDRIRLVIVDLDLILHLLCGQNIESIRIIRRIFTYLRREDSLLPHINIAVDPGRPQLIIVPVHEDPVIILRFGFPVFRDSDNDIGIDMIPAVRNIAKSDHRFPRILFIRCQCDEISQFLPYILIEELQSPLVGDPRHLLLGTAVILPRREVVHFVARLCSHGSLTAGKDPV